jgi:hypothetical protein
MSRPKPPKAVETELLVRSRRRCALCFGLDRSTSIVKGQIAHVDRNPTNNAVDNLAWLCLPHHDEYDSRPSQSKGFTPHELVAYRNELYTFNNASTEQSANEQLLPELRPVATHSEQQAASTLTIELLPTTTSRGQQPKLLVRITDPNGDFRTQWSVTVISPSGVEYSSLASWPGSGKIFRARFATTEPRTGTWHGVAVRNATESHMFEASLPYPDAA